nr:hypothetical protein K-LCC10_0021 [Kaumoebavirus]
MSAIFDRITDQFGVGASSAILADLVIKNNLILEFLETGREECWPKLEEAMGAENLVNTLQEKLLELRRDNLGILVEIASQSKSVEDLITVFEYLCTNYLEALDDPNFKKVALEKILDFSSHPVHGVKFRKYLPKIVG